MINRNMLNCNTTIPTHIHSFIVKLKLSYNLQETLLQHTYLLQSDMTLFGIYLGLGYDPITSSFLKPVSLQNVLLTIDKEYETPENTVAQMSGNTYSPYHEKNTSRNRESNGKYALPYKGIGLLNGNTIESPLLNDDSQNSIWSKQTNDIYSSDFLASDPFSELISATHISYSAVKSLKGLKALSIYLKDIVKDKCFNSYKDVTDLVVQDIGVKENTTEMRNIRRRLYDALNVMNAIGYVDIATKEFNLELQPSNYTQLMQDKADCIQDKREILKDLVKKVESMSKIFQRNSKKRHREVVPFPFIIIAVKHRSSSVNDLKVKTSFQPHRNLTILKSSSPFEVLGDIDVVLKMKLKCGRSEKVPEEVYRLLKHRNTSS